MNPKLSNTRLSNTKLTDDAVAELPLHRGRAGPLEEIMSTPVLDDRPVTQAAPHRRSGRLVPAAAAAAVAALVAGAAWLGGGPAGTVGGGDDAGAGIAAAPTPGALREVLDAPGWTMEGASVDADGGGSISYSKGGRSLEINRYPADLYGGRLEGHRRSGPIEVLGRDARMWAYTTDDHAAIRTVEGGHFLSFRGSGMDEAAYLALLSRLRVVDQDAFAATMPDSFLSKDERPGAIDTILDGIDEVADPLLPPGLIRSSITSDQVDPPLLEQDVVSAVACGWLAEWMDGHRSGDQHRMQRAVAVLGTARAWPVLQAMDGGYPEVVEAYADEITAGQVPVRYEGGLGCQD